MYSKQMFPLLKYDCNLRRYNLGSITRRYSEKMRPHFILGRNEDWGWESDESRAYFRALEHSIQFYPKNNIKKIGVSNKEEISFLLFWQFHKKLRFVDLVIHEMWLFLSFSETKIYPVLFIEKRECIQPCWHWLSQEKPSWYRSADFVI